jgi:hypothetical protein
VACDAATPTACAVSGGKACVDEKTDAQYCGNCNTHCAAGKKCTNGVCTGSACAPGLTTCNNACVNTQSDPTNCGACGNGCPAVLNANNKCQSGACKASCDAGFKACPVNLNLQFRCVDTQKDEANCGDCGILCGADQVCANGSCKPFIYASACWECGNGNAFPLCCPLGGQTICTNAAVCP